MGGVARKRFSNSQFAKFEATPPLPSFFTIVDKMYWVLIIHKSQITKLEATSPLFLNQRNNH